MSPDRIDTRPDTDRDALFREVVMLRARCSNLRHWCRALLDDPRSVGILPEATVAELRDTPPEVTKDEGQTVVALLARGGQVPASHPLAPKSEVPASHTAGAWLLGGFSVVSVPLVSPLISIAALLGAGRFIPDDLNQLQKTLNLLTAEHDRLRQAFFALYDHLHPDDNLTDEYFLAQQGAGPMRPMADVLAEIEREFAE